MDSKETASNKYNSELVQRTYDLYASNSSYTPPEKSNSFSEAYVNFKKSIEKARESMVSKEINSVDALKPDLQSSLKEIQRTVPKDKLAKITNINDQQKNKALSTVSSTGKELNNEQKTDFIKRMDNIKVTKDVSHINASIVTSLIDNLNKDH